MSSKLAHMHPHSTTDQFSCQIKTRMTRL